MKQKDPLDMSDPWKREAQEKLEKQQRLEAVEFLQQEMQELQAKAKRTAEENDRLRKLNLEWQFQKRLQEIQQRGDDEDEDNDLDMMVMIQQLEKSMSQAKVKEKTHWKLYFLSLFFVYAVQTLLIHNTVGTSSDSYLGHTARLI